MKRVMFVLCVIGICCANNAIAMELQGAEKARQALNERIADLTLLSNGVISDEMLSEDILKFGQRHNTAGFQLAFSVATKPSSSYEEAREMLDSTYTVLAQEFQRSGNAPHDAEEFYVLAIAFMDKVAKLKKVAKI